MGSSKMISICGSDLSVGNLWRDVTLKYLHPSPNCKRHHMEIPKITQPTIQGLYPRSHYYSPLKDTQQLSRALSMDIAMYASIVSRQSLGLFVVILFISMAPARCFQEQSRQMHFSLHSRIGPILRQRPMLHSTPQKQVMIYRPIFDFTNQTTVSRFERIDDAIMGGISLSSLKQSADENFARWSGICRLDGGYVFFR